jgi:hypothetical protein
MENVCGCCLNSLAVLNQCFSFELKDDLYKSRTDEGKRKEEEGKEEGGKYISNQ